MVRKKVESLGSVPVVVEGVATATMAAEVDLQGLRNMALELKAKRQLHLRHELLLNCLSL